MLFVVIPVGSYWHSRVSIHWEAPEYFEKFLGALTARWALDDVSPIFSASLVERTTRKYWEDRLLCFAQLGRLKSHGRPMTSDSALFLGRVMYLVPGRFENGEATFYVWISKSEGRIRVDGLNVAAGENALNDDSWCKAFHGWQQEMTN